MADRLQVHLAGYSASLNSTSMTAITPLTDDLFQSVVNTNFYSLPSDIQKVLAHSGIGATITRQRIVAPSLNPVYPEFERLNVAAEPSSPAAVNEFAANGISIPIGEQVSVESANAGGGAEQNDAFLWFARQNYPISRDAALETRPLRLTGTTTLVANTWTKVPLTFTYTPKPGVYRIYGMNVRSAGAEAARIVPPDGGYRMGVLGNDAAGDIDPEWFRYGRFGNGAWWSEFTDLTAPTIEVMSASADTAETVILDIAYNRPRPAGTATGGPDPRKIA